MFENFFDLSKPVGADETWVSIFVVVFLMWMGYKFLKKQAKKHENALSFNGVEESMDI